MALDSSPDLFAHQFYVFKIKSFISGNTAHRKTKNRQKHTQNHKQTEGQTDKIKQTTSTNYKLTTSTTLLLLLLLLSSKDDLTIVKPFKTKQQN